VLRLSPRQIQSLATLICGDGEDSPTDYRRFVDIEAFISFTGVHVDADSLDGASRWKCASSFVQAAQSSNSEGSSGLARDAEQVIESLLDLREFSSEDRRDEALLKVNQILAGIPVEAQVAGDGSVSIASTTQPRSQRVLDEQIHTTFGEVIADSSLAASRMHYAKAQRFLNAADPDYENAAKEAVSALESLAKTLTGESDYTRAIKKATDAGLIPRPIDDIAIKLFAYRGNEPGVAHGSADTPDVTADEARLVYNLAGSLGAFLAAALRTSDPSSRQAR
jgi:hypothetical protein